MKTFVLKIKICFCGWRKCHYKCMVLKHTYYKNKVEETSAKLVRMENEFKKLNDEK